MNAREEFVYDTPLSEGDSSKWFAGAVYQFTGRDHTDRLLECAVTETDEVDQLLSKAFWHYSPGTDYSGDNYYNLLAAGRYIVDQAD